MKKGFLLIALFLFTFILSACETIYKTVSFDVDGNVTQVQVEIKSKVDKPEDPVKEGYKFIGWYLKNEEFDFDNKILKDITLVAKFEEDNIGIVDKIYYNVVFKDYDDTILKEEQVEKGSDALAPASPNRDGYIFSGWDESYTNVTKDLVIKATYVKEDANTFLVTFKDYDGKTLKEELVEAGHSANAPSDPSRIGYTFVSWDKDFSNVEADLIVNATYKINIYNVVFKDYDGKILSNQNIEYGKSATAPANPTRTGYNFKSWDKSFRQVTNDLEIFATYEIITYTVIFKDYDGKVLKQEIVNYHANATAPASPNRDGYVFKSWDKDYTQVSSDLIVTARYEEISLENNYAITYNLGDGTYNALSKNEFIKLFLSDYYDFLNLNITKDEFIYGEDNTFTGKWKDYIGGYFSDSVNHLLKSNDLTLNDDAYFFNSSKYKNRWSCLVSWVKAMNNRLDNGLDSSYYGGSIDLYRYCISDAMGYDSAYGDNFNLYPNNLTIAVNSYKSSDKDIILDYPYRDNFDGWYLNSDFSGNKITYIKTGSAGSINLYAKWRDIEETTYEISFNVDGGIKVDSMTVNAGSSIVLPRTTKGGYLFNSWKLDDKYYQKGDIFTPESSVVFKAIYNNNLQNLVYSGDNVTYRNSTTVVQIPIEYESKVNEFRAAWVSCYVGDYSPSTNQTTMMANLTEVLDVLQSFNMNAIVFHIRITNDACYKTDLAPIRSGFGNIETFNNWDYLTWFIEECHERGIEFHAWLNPYRIKAYGYSASTTTADVASQYAAYPKNPASKAENVLLTYRSDGTHGAILNPCKEEVQDYIVDVCLDIMEHYDIDAIHFDDYFYAQLSENYNFLEEADKADYEAYIDAHPACNYSKTSSANKQQWRRDNVDLFIYKLHNAMTNFNKTNHKSVQLGIAPTGIYKNGNGVVTYNGDGSITTTGSNTSGQTHYSSYLFCDTVKWIRNGWIDYICPQSYWAFTHSTAGYADVVDWWDKVVEGTRVNLYTGMGIYMSTDYTSSKSWYTEEYECSNQVLYNTKFNNVKGTCIYVYSRIKQIYNDENAVQHPGLLRIKNEYWSEYVAPPKTMASQYGE